MQKKVETFNKIFKDELKHLIEDVNDLIEYEKQLHREDIHRNYVYLENLVVLKDEIMGFNGIMSQVDNFLEDIEFDEITTRFFQKITDFIKERGYPEAIENLIKRKIDRTIMNI